MSSFADYLTVEGERLLANAAAGKATITFTKVVMGTGYMPANTNTKNMTGVVTPVKELEVKSVALNDNTSVVVSAYFSNETIEEGFYFREKGIYMSDGDEEVLGIYGNAGTNAEFIDTAAVCTIEKSIRTVINMTSDELANITLKTGTEARAPIIIDGLTLVEFVKTDTALTIEDGQMVILNDIVYVFTGGDSNDVDNYSPGMKLSDVYKEKVEGADANGGIGASQNALHAVYEVAADINNKTPTYTEASTLATLTSGEKLSVAFGKIKKAISTLISHIATKATTSVLGHVKLSDSTAVTTYDGLALPTREKNASISGTLANQIANRLPLAGGTMTGNINIIKSGDAQIYLKDTDSGAMHGTLVANQNEIGMYSNTHSNWIWYHTADGVSKFIGNASTATTANAAKELKATDRLAYNGGTAGWGNESNFSDKNGVRVGYINTQYVGDGTVNFVLGADKGSVLIHGNNSHIATANKAACDWNGNNIVNTYFPKTGGTVTGNVAVTGDVCCDHYCTATYGATMKIETSGFINLQTAQSVQVRNQDDTGWRAISASSFVQQSSRRYKKNIVDMSEERARGVLKLRPVVYDYINEVDGTDCLGLIVEEVDEVEKYPVMYNEKGEPEGIDYSRLVPMLIKMVQMQEERIVALENK